MNTEIRLPSRLSDIALVLDVMKCLYYQENKYLLLQISFYNKKWKLFI